MDAYLAEFKAYVFAESQTEANDEIAVWRSLAAASGFDPGQGHVSRVKSGELARLPRLQQALERAREKLSGGPAGHWHRQRAITALATHLGGDVDRAAGVIESIEKTVGPLSTTLAKALDSTRRTEAAA